MAPFTCWWSAWSGSDGCELEVHSDDLVTVELQFTIIIEAGYLFITPSDCGSNMLHLLQSCELSKGHEIAIVLGISLPKTTPNNYLG